MTTTTDYPRYYGNGTGRDSYIHANNGGLRNTSRTGDFRIHLRGGPPLLSDGTRLGGGIPLAAGIAGGARPIRLPTLDGRKKQTGARQRAISDWLSTSRTPRASGLQVTDHFAALDVDMQYEVNSSRRAALPVAPHHGGIVRSPRLYNYNRPLGASGKTLSFDDATHNTSNGGAGAAPIGAISTPRYVPRPPHMTRSAPLASSHVAAVHHPVTSSDDDLAPADEDAHKLTNDIAPTQAANRDIPATPLTYDPFARGFDIVRSTGELDTLATDGSQTSRTRGRPAAGLSARNSDGSLTARNYYHTNWMRKDGF